MTPVFSVPPQSLLYKRVDEAQFRSQLANEMMKYHMMVKHPFRALLQPIQLISSIYECRSSHFVRFGS